MPPADSSLAVQVVDLAIRFIGVIIWPAIILVAILVFRKQIAPLIPNITRLDVPGMSLEVTPPRGIREGRFDTITGEGSTGASLTPRAEEFFNSGGHSGAAIDPLREDVYLLHSATKLDSRTIDGKNWYAVRIWVEADPDSALQNFRRVTYKLHDSFSQPLVATERWEREFEIWLRVWGEFNVYAYVEVEAGQPFLLSRFLDLPGRPED